MPDLTSEPGPDDEQAAASASGTPGSAAAGGAARPEGLDWRALLDALAAGGLLDGDPDGQDEVAAEEQSAAADGQMSAPRPPTAGSAWGRTGGRRGCAATRWGRSRWR
jgi:hypothetical protein